MLQLAFPSPESDVFENKIIPSVYESYKFKWRKEIEDNWTIYWIDSNDPMVYYHFGIVYATYKSNLKP